ncbi:MULTISPECIES: hypothetical protein [Novosphingobium]|uniref:Uncharacterized protein n=2 Tax=Novosphingobium TaxID=165696 RepID=A0ABT0A7H9_9SPHN|nr:MULTISPECIES: hypothetical protein [Novosphingobium]MED5547052.1 hypothetical protein [Pseudomonadota bacterium]MCJ1959153.1 hypothetical protein [Novosphingobium mangrovi (ex Hu et al. 2023)]QVM85758.1 hypothetical protein HT578_20470 [Novosphingobium decolorationis]TYC92923.1 hypothetical protein FMM79_02660 [Novosphingobium sp. BW1]GAM07297.1 hypothetical conserved protein [Novosphingobium sp. MBES04]
MNEDITLTLTTDEVAMLVDALEVDLEGYLESSKEAESTGNRSEVKTFNDAALRIQTLMAKLQEYVPE